jgi:hypothetical protein
MRADVDRMHGQDPDFLAAHTLVDETVRQLEAELRSVEDRVHVVTAGLLPILLQREE